MEFGEVPIEACSDLRSSTQPALSRQKPVTS